MSDVEAHTPHLKTEMRNGEPWTVLVIETDIPIPAETHIDKDNLLWIGQKIKQGYLDRGQRIDEVRLVEREKGPKGTTE